MYFKIKTTQKTAKNNAPKFSHLKITVKMVDTGYKYEKVVFIDRKLNYILISKRPIFKNARIPVQIRSNDSGYDIFYKNRYRCMNINIKDKKNLL